MQNRHMSNHFGKISKMSAHVCRMAAHMYVFLCFPLCSHVPRPSTALYLCLSLRLTITLPQSRPLPLPRRGHPPLPRTVPVPKTLALPVLVPQPLVLLLHLPHPLRLPVPCTAGAHFEGPSPSTSP